MDKTVERLWVDLLDSDGFRRFASDGVGHTIMSSQAFRKALFAKNYLSSAIARMRQPDLFRGVETFTLFVGHNKSGTSMLGSLLDAHPEIIMADEVRVLDYVTAGFQRDQIFHLLLKCSRRELMKGRVTARRLTPYSYLVPDQHQGEFTQLKVIGDGAAGSTTRRFGEEPELFERLRALLGEAEVKLIQVIRNPFDPISVMMVRGKRSFQNSIDHYFTSCEVLTRLRRLAKGPRLHPVRYEDFVLNPSARLRDLCHFLGVEAPQDYLQACAGILRPKPVWSRGMVDWSPDWIRVVEDQIARYDFLEGYSFES
jgi:hypothetical protein